MKGFLNVLCSVLLIVVGGWSVVGVQHGIHLVAAYNLAVDSHKAITAERDRLLTQISELQSKLGESEAQFEGAQRIIAELGDKLAAEKGMRAEAEADSARLSSELGKVRNDHARLTRDYEAIVDTLDRLRAERSVLVAQ